MSYIKSSLNKSVILLVALSRLHKFWLRPKHLWQNGHMSIFLSLYGASFIKGHPVREEICKCHSTSVKLIPDHPWSPFSYDEKAKRRFVCQLRNVRRLALHCPVYSGWKLSSDKRKWEMWWRFQSYETPLVEEKQRCNVTWIFLQVFNQDEKMALFDSSLLSTMFLLDRTEPQSLCMLNLRKSSNNFSMTYWLF